VRQLSYRSVVCRNEGPEFMSSVDAILAALAGRLRLHRSFFSPCTFCNDVQRALLCVFQKLATMHAIGLLSNRNYP
jgi:hypothetical protein